MKKGNLNNKSKRPGYKVDLAGHIATCDANYLRLVELFPGIRYENDIALPLTFGTWREKLLLEIIEKTPYTTLVRLSCAPGQTWHLKQPLVIRLYHDARSAEVVEYQKDGYFRAKYEYPNSEGRQPDEIVQMNRFLGELLVICAKYEEGAGDAILV